MASRHRGIKIAAGGNPRIHPHTISRHCRGDRRGRPTSSPCSTIGGRVGEESIMASCHRVKKKVEPRAAGERFEKALGARHKWRLFHLALKPGVCYNRLVLDGLTRKRSLPISIAWAVAAALALGGSLRFASPIQLAEVAPSLSACSAAHCGDFDDDSPISAEISLLCCEHQGDSDCACCYPLTGTFGTVADLRRLRDSNQPIDRSITRVVCWPLPFGHSLLTRRPTSVHVSNSESLLKLKSLLIV